MSFTYRMLSSRNRVSESAHRERRNFSTFGVKSRVLRFSRQCLDNCSSAELPRRCLGDVEGAEHVRRVLRLLGTAKGYMSTQSMWPLPAGEGDLVDTMEILELFDISGTGGHVLADLGRGLVVFGLTAACDENKRALYSFDLQACHHSRSKVRTRSARPVGASADACDPKPARLRALARPRRHGVAAL